MKPRVTADRTVPDDIPPVHVLEAAQSQDRKETEDLLAGFDRPGRGPKAASKERDFVDYYAKKKSGAVDSGPSGAPRSAGGGAAAGEARGGGAARGIKQVDVATVVKPRKREGVPPWLVWGGAGLVMLLIGGLVAYLATAESAPTAVKATGPTTATAISASLPAPNGRDVIPPPQPVDPNATTTMTTGAVVVESASPSPTGNAPSTTTASTGSSRGGRRDGRGAGENAGANANANVNANANANANAGANAGSAKPPPRDDFLRDM